LAEINIVESRQVPPAAIMLLGFPDVGLVGVIAASHLVEELDLAEVAYMESKMFPPLIVLHDGLPHSTIRVFGNHAVMLAISETPVAADMIYPVIDTLLQWGRGRKVKMVISLSGIPVQERQEIKELKVFAAA
jgi:uncharacterized protein